MKKIICFLLFLGTFSHTILAQSPSNDECSNPIVLTSVSSWCSGTTQYSNNGATASQSNPFCGSSGFQNDVWFAFTAQAFTVSISITAENGNPNIAIYEAACSSTMSSISGCALGSTGTTNIFKEGLIPGATYLIQIGCSATSSFQLCINNYNAPVTPGSDCVTASFLCDKSSFTVQSVTSAGNVLDEARGSCLGGNGQTSENSSTWFKWICDTPGSLTFVLTPNNIQADLDFVVYELPQGINDCNKTVLRCEASGGESGRPYACSGATGLSLTDTDTTEPPGCSGGNNNFVRYIDMVSGHAYALMVNNYSDGSNGFRLDFGGTGTFLGPKSDFTISPLRACIGNPITITDASVAGIGSIVGNTWSFGAGAQPNITASGVGPYTISYNTFGTKPILHTIQSSEGCKVTKTLNVIIDTLSITATTIPPTCGGGQDGGAQVNVSRGIAPFQYLWSNGSTTNLIQSVGQGIYTVTVTDSGTCTQSSQIAVRELTLIAAANTNSNPLCFQSATGNITIQIVNGDPPYSFDFGNTGVFQNNNIFNNLNAGAYIVNARDRNDCIATFRFTLTEPSLLVLTKSDSSNLSCYQNNSGRATISASGGTPNYTYIWSDNENTPRVSNLPSGTHTVTTTDSQGCTQTATFALTEPPPILINQIYVRNSGCFAQNKGSISVIDVTGGTLPYNFSSNCTTYQTDSILQNLGSGTYTVCVRDAAGCSISTTAAIGEPPPLYVYAGEDVRINLGDTTTLRATTKPFGAPGSFLWLPPNDLSCPPCKTTTAAPTLTQAYIVQFTNLNGCIYTDTLVVSVNPIRPVFIPNTFTPNNDGRNDIFQPYGTNAVRNIKTFRVFDRWGELVYETYNAPMPQNGIGGIGWDGTFRNKLLNPGVFVYVIELNFIDGGTQTYTGDINLIY